VETALGSICRCTRELFWRGCCPNFNQVNTFQSIGPVMELFDTPLYITNIFKHSYIKIAFRTNNTLQNHLIHNNQNPGKFSLSGVCKLICPDCMKVYIG
jgi:hypothetical protein